MLRAFTRKITITALALALCGAGQTTFPGADCEAGVVTPVQLNDHNSQVSKSTSAFVYSRATKLYNGKLTIKNTGAGIDGTLVVVLNNLPGGVTQTNRNGIINGAPYTLVSGGLATGAEVTIPLTFSNPANARITFTAGVNQLINGTVNAEAVRSLSAPFTIAALPDTQVYSEENNIGFQKQVEWVMANAAGKNIAFVTHLGDVVDNGTDAVQWTNAMTALDTPPSSLLDQEYLPFSIVRGNHDDPTFYLNNITPAITQGKPWFIEAAPGNLTQAQVFRVEGACFLHIGFQKDPTQDELIWANTLLAKPELQGLPVIVSTHDYIDGSGQSTTGRRIWNEFVNNNPMVFMVLNGHTHTEYALVNHNTANRPVYQMLSDYQDRSNAGNGLMRLVTIDPAVGKIQVKTFSPWYNKGVGAVGGFTSYYETDGDSEFEYVVNVGERLAVDTTFDFGDEPPAPPLPVLNAIPAPPAANGVSYSHIFQNRRPLVGTTTPYAGTVDVQINENNANISYAGEATLTTDMDDNGSRVHAFLRFDDIVGTGPGQIPPGAEILSANLVFTSSTKGKVKMHRMLVPWGEQSVWNDFTPQPVSWTSMDYLNTDTGIYRYITLPSVMVDGGVQADDVEAASLVDFEFTMPKPVPAPFFILTQYGTTYQAPAWDPNTGLPITLPAKETLTTTTANLTATVQAWVNGTAPNHGWFFEPTSSDGWDFETAEGKQPPALVVIVKDATLVQ